MRTRLATQWLTAQAGRRCSEAPRSVCGDRRPIRWGPCGDVHATDQSITMYQYVLLHPLWVVCHHIRFCTYSYLCRLLEQVQTAPCNSCMPHGCGTPTTMAGFGEDARHMERAASGCCQLTCQPWPRRASCSVGMVADVMQGPCLCLCCDCFCLCFCLLCSMFVWRALCGCLCGRHARWSK